jgi:hypothetical protein
VGPPSRVSKPQSDANDPRGERSRRLREAADPPRRQPFVSSCEKQGATRISPQCTRDPTRRRPHSQGTALRLQSPCMFKGVRAAVNPWTVGLWWGRATAKRSYSLRADAFRFRHLRLAYWRVRRTATDAACWRRFALHLQAPVRGSSSSPSRARRGGTARRVSPRLQISSFGYRSRPRGCGELTCHASR